MSVQDIHSLQTVGIQVVFAYALCMQRGYKPRELEDVGWGLRTTLPRT